MRGTPLEFVEAARVQLAAMTRVLVRLLVLAGGGMGGGLRRVAALDRGRTIARLAAITNAEQETGRNRRIASISVRGGPLMDAEYPGPRGHGCAALFVQ
jgi:hypothetical protein